ncbi:cytochrome c6, chloroplastic isoform X2 [Phoenix dactylifera]|uniref:Cytochrome c-553 n=1 Tax=Phoenix dactylifera TaxID=42345 RepID=A0A8B8Z826_PHODC|nr:cytochrome c6, chloroplastic isoform X2 [Phoenix dactylifera]
MEPLRLISLNKSIHCFTTKGCLRKEENPCDQHHLQKRTVRVAESLVSPLMSAILTLSAPSLAAPPVSFSQPISEGRALFQKACIGCHDMGGNILQPGATLFMKDLERNGVATEEGIYNITYYGKGRMPGFGEKCTPKGQCTFGPRLQEDEIKLLAEFVKSQADRGWPNIKSYGD